MKHYQIWNAVPAWQRLSALKKKPPLAYRLLKYVKEISAEMDVCEERRKQFVYEISGVAPGLPVSLEEGTPQYADLIAKFNEFMQGESDLEVLSLTMDELITAIGEEDGNRISEDDIELLEPFFTA